MKIAARLIVSWMRGECNQPVPRHGGYPHDHLFIVFDFYLSAQDSRRKTNSLQPWPEQVTNSTRRKP